MNNRLYQLKEEQKQLEQRLEKCKQEQRMIMKSDTQFNGTVYVVCAGIRTGNPYENGAASIALYLTKEQAKEQAPGRVIKKVSVGTGFNIVPFEDKNYIPF